MINKEKGIALYAAMVAFGTYVFVFGFRKSFTVCTFDGLMFGPIAYKTALVISQMLGYLSAKFYGIRFISGLEKKNRYKIIFLLTGIAWAAWLLFALVPAPYNVIFLLVNGFPLGMLWGVVFSYVEGRKSTDFIGAALAVSFIFSSGWVKSVGGWLIQNFAISEFWVPFATGLVFAIPLIIFFIVYSCCSTTESICITSVIVVSVISNIVSGLNVPIPTLDMFIIFLLNVSI